MREVVFYTKKGCSLCDRAMAVVEATRLCVNFALRVVDIESDPEIFEDYRYDIPVIEIDGKRAFRYRVDREALLERLQR